MAFRSLRRRRGRTVLTVAGIVVGVALILVLLSLTAGTSTQTSGLIRNLLPAQITVVNATTPTSGGGAGLRALFGTADTMDQTMAQAIGKLPGVYAVSAQLSTVGSVEGTSALIFGVDPATYTNVTGGLNMISGVIFSNSSREAVLGQTLAANLNLGVGSKVSVGVNGSTVSDTVVGVYSSGTRFLDRSVYLPLDQVQSFSGEAGQVSEIFVKTSTSNDVPLVAQQIATSFPNVRTVQATNFSQVASTLSDTLTSLFTVIGLVALLAGAFGVVNTMMMSVGERTREIGTLRAIGATKGQVMKLFISEAFLIGLVGGAAGVIVGATITFALPATTGRSGGVVGNLLRGSLAPTLTPTILLISLGLGVIVGVLAGLYPAWRASKLDPVEALRHV